MDSLAQTALDFCRECLGWEPDAWTLDDCLVIWGERESGPSLRFTDLNAVMDAVRKWCDGSGCRIELHYSPEQAGFGVLCEGIDTWNADLCHALLAACVEASRKLRAA